MFKPIGKAPFLLPFCITSAKVSFSCSLIRTQDLLVTSRQRQPRDHHPCVLPTDKIEEPEAVKEVFQLVETNKKVVKIMVFYDDFSIDTFNKEVN